MNLQLFKKGVLFARLSHEMIADVAGSKAGFNEDDVAVLATHSNDPDYMDWFFDRFWKHFYDVGSGFGGAPQSCERQYMLSVNNVDLISLSCASHYLMDCGCVFHTTFYGQYYHISYEQWIDDNLDEIVALIDVDSIQPIFIDNIYDAVVELATKTYSRYGTIMGLLDAGNVELLKAETADNLSETISYVYGFYNKFINDVENNVTYDVPVEATLNQLMVISLVLSLPFLYLSRNSRNK